MSETVLSIVHGFFWLFATKTLRAGQFPAYPQFADKETEDQKVQRKDRGLATGCSGGVLTPRSVLD